MKALKKISGSSAFEQEKATALRTFEEEAIEAFEKEMRATDEWLELNKAIAPEIDPYADIESEPINESCPFRDLRLLSVLIYASYTTPAHEFNYYGV